MELHAVGTLSGPLKDYYTPALCMEDPDSPGFSMRHLLVSYVRDTEDHSEVLDLY